MSDSGNESPLGTSLRDFLHIRIKQSGLKPAEIARRAGIAPALIYRFENDQRDLSLVTIDKILPVIDGEIGAKLMEFLLRHEQLVAQEGALIEAIMQLRTNEGAVESAILGLQEAIEVLAKIRNATGYEFKEAIGYGLPETPESIDAEIRAMMESEIDRPTETEESIDEEIRALIESGVDQPDVLPGAGGQEAPETDEPGDLTEMGELDDPDLPEIPDIEDVDETSSP